jgi:trimeric autotransporter adhesin
VNQLIQCKKTTSLVLITFVLGLTLAPSAQAVVPPPDGGYPNGNTAEGTNALQSLTTGSVNTAVGLQALFSNIEGSNNTATGANALFSNTDGNSNTALGLQALFSNTTGSTNTATGIFALESNTTGSFNIANGGGALDSNTTGSFNTANGVEALHSNTEGSHNTATGFDSLSNNTTGSTNTATGVEALHNNTTSSHNTATGGQALFGNTTGSFNTANGVEALLANTTGDNNTATGVSALHNDTTGSNNIALGFQAGFNLTTGSCNIDIGNNGLAGESNTIRIGTVGGQRGCGQTATFIAGIIGSPIAGPTVHISGTGQLGIGPPSSVRFKQNIKPMDKASDAILALKPVTFRYKKEIDPDALPQFGLVAEDVEKVNPDLVARDRDGKPYMVRYEAVNAMLLNEFLKEHRKLQEQDATIMQLKSTDAKQEAIIAQQQKQIEALTAGLQKVSDQLELSKPAPQIAVSNQ